MTRVVPIMKNQENITVQTFNACGRDNLSIPICARAWNIASTLLRWKKLVYIWHLMNKMLHFQQDLS